MDHTETRNRAPGSTHEPNTIDRRRTERFPFSAVALLVEPRSQTRMSVRIADISSRGCYADALNGMPVGTKVIISIDHSNAQIKTGATVTYSLPGMGMGLSFEKLPSEMESVINRWIAEVRGETGVLPEAERAVIAVRKERASERHILSSLIGLMIRKNLIAESEGNELLDELLHED